MSFFSTAGADANNSPTVKFTTRSKIRFVIVVAPTDSFNRLTTQGCFFLSKLYFAVAVSASSMAVSRTAGGVAIGKAGKPFVKQR